MFKRLIVFAPFLFVLLLGQGCIKIQTGGSGSDGGVFKSVDKGINWAQKAIVLSTPARPQNIAGLNVNKLVIDPSDKDALYLATAGAGVFYSLDGGEGWLQSRSLKSGDIYDVAVDPRNKCVIYAATANKLLKSTDCARTWGTVFVDSRSEVLVTRVVIDKTNASIVYLAASNSLNGDIAKSTDGGATWKPTGHWPGPIMKMVIDAVDPNKIYVATQLHGLQRTTNAGATWTDLSPKLDTFPGTRDFSDLVVDPSVGGTVYYVSIYGILKSTNSGESFEKLDLLTPPGSTRIYSFAVNPSNSAEIFYGTATTFYKSKNDGRQWETKKLPTSRVAKAIVIDTTNPNVMYLVTYKVK